MRRARIAIKWGCLPSCVQYAGFSPSFTKLAMCQHLKGCDGEPAIQWVSKSWNGKDENRLVLTNGGHVSSFFIRGQPGWACGRRPRTAGRYLRASGETDCIGVPKSKPGNRGKER